MKTILVGALVVGAFSLSATARAAECQAALTDTDGNVVNIFGIGDTSDSKQAACTSALQGCNDALAALATGHECQVADLENENTDPEALQLFPNPFPGDPEYPGYPGFPGGYQPNVGYVTCESVGYGYRTCFVGGRVLNARLVNQFSFVPCIQGRNWGTTRNAIWVSGGCRGTFEVRRR